jgi:hypothetical protein
MKITSIHKSGLKTKRFVVFLDDGSNYNFGLKTGSTYIDHHNEMKRDNYRARHLGNIKEKQLIESFTPSPALFSFYILWGPHTDINKNIQFLNKKLK